MFKLSDILSKLGINKNNTSKDEITDQSTQSPVNDSAPEQGTSAKTKNWYEERFDKVLVQRNILFILILILLALSIVSMVVVSYVVNSKEFDPFVIQIDESTGMAKVANPISSEILEGNDALARYFIKKYVIARETYNPVDFNTEARKTIRLLSSPSIFLNFLGYIKNKDIDPTILYGQKNTTFLQVKSWTKLPADKNNKKENRYMLRFSINETLEGKRVFNKIAVIEFEYIPMELTEEERNINPIGFQVKGYNVNDDNS